MYSMTCRMSDVLLGLVSGGRGATANSSRAVLLSACAGLATLTASAVPVLAQECTLSVHARPNVLYSGQSADVSVLAHIPANIYAYASTQFNVHATLPGWTFASSGTIAGSDVLGMDVWQSHAPRRGAFADPANPTRIWRGAYAPITNQPALVEINADPSRISVYPDRRTSSWVPALAEGGSSWVFVNPLRVEAWLAAPGAGTQASTCCTDDVIVDGRIITGQSPGGEVRIGLLLPAIQSLRESAVRVAFDDSPASFATMVEVNAAGIGGVGTGTVMFSAHETPRDGQIYELAATFSRTGDAPVRYHALLRGVSVASGDLNADGAPLWVDRVPDQIAARVDARPLRVERESHSTYELETVLVSSYSTSGATGGAIHVLLPDGRLVVADTIEVMGIATVTSSSNLRQFGLGAHILEARGVRSMTIEPEQPR